MYADVTVVGAGPVGLVLAAELALSGVTVQVLERLAEPETSMKAGGINVPTAEALDRRGLLPAAERVHRETMERMGAAFGRKAGAGAGAAATPSDGRGAGAQRQMTGHFAGMVIDAGLVDWDDPDLAAHAAVAGARMVPQRELEGLLATHVERLGVPVRRGVEVTGFEDTGDGVLVSTTAGAIRTGWLVGCDGGHSTVRRLAGIDFPGTDAELTGRVAVVDMADSSVLDEGWVWSSRGAYRRGPQPGRVFTVEFDAARRDDAENAGTRPHRGAPAEPVTLEEMQASLRRVSGTDVTLTALHGAATRWSDNTRQAATYRSGRVLLAGDAAHVHSPFGGQGLNLGVGDAMNLGWKLGAVVAGWAPEGLLDTYDTERRPLGAWVLDWTRAQAGVMRGDAKSVALREIVAELLATRSGATYAVKKISGVTQRVEVPGDHPLAGRHAPDIRLADGSRLANHSHAGGFMLLDRTPDGAFARAAATWAGRVRSVPDGTDAAGAARAEPAGVLVRPDGVVAWAADEAEATPTAVTALEAALHRWAGAPAHEPVA
ncbi:FAD-dependent oxidoreductase [Streptomyces montanisoli]|uniref:FAD-dependent oxidoreductase n=1 Tax=Streptomyces montanisoli TaxID=2798581 RepID=A0A940MEZ2_9ACTN|nr:FAD-dependent oxidoreductase [Streptomyces montanisoli]MBP0459101.1 FAD-dependent oxidoreductase [Streptomyces montanisoli]